MSEFRVWAPAAASMEAALGAARFAMRRGEGGWWSAEVAQAGEGCDYGFVIDGEGPLPDPRSPWQPRGVHGLSRLVDHGRFSWSDARFVAPPLYRAIVYELHVGTFTPEGTFEAAAARLDHLRALGVTHVELMPVAEFAGERGWGYDGVDLYAPHHAYGGPEGLKRLVDACHAKGLAVLLDVVCNHLGPSGNYLGRFGPYFTSRYSTPWGEAVNFDGPDSDEVRRFFCDNALTWLRDYHFDGLRIDAVHAIVDTSAVHILEELAREVAALEAKLRRRLVLVAESDLNDPRIVRAPELGGFGLDALWSDDFHHALHAVLTGERAGYYADFGRLADLAAALQKVYVYDGQYSAFRRRRHGRPVERLSGHRFLGYLQNHDQVGNRARGERAGRLMSLGRLKIGAAVVVTAPFVPLIFQGEEWAASTPFQYFTDHREPELARAVSEGRRREFAALGCKPEEIPDPQAEETFRRSKLDWSEADRGEHALMLEWWRRLVRLRAETPALSDGCLDDVRVEFDEERRWLRMDRGPVSVACNLRAEPQRIPLRAASGGRLAITLASEPPRSVGSDGVELTGESVAILIGSESSRKQFVSGP